MVGEIPPPLTVIVAVRWEVNEFAEAVTVTVLSLESEAGEIVSQDDGLLFTFQLVFEVIVNVFCSPEDKKLSDEGDITGKFHFFLIDLPFLRPFLL